MKRHLPITLAFVIVAVAWGLWQRGCGRALPDIDVANDAILVRNQSTDDWQDVRVWVNDYYSGTTTLIRAGGFAREPIGRFVAAQGQKINVNTTPITSVVVLAHTSGGAPVRIVWGKPFWH